MSGAIVLELQMMTKQNLSHIIYVDDEPDMRMLVQAVLESNGVRVTLCESGLEVLEFAHDSAPQMIILDVMIAGMDGPAILEEIKADRTLSHIPVIFLTAKSEAAAIESLKNMGAIGIINKPFDLMTLTDQIRALWESAHG